MRSLRRSVPADTEVVRQAPGVGVGHDMWDPARWRPRAVLRRVGRRLGATRARRVAVRLLSAVVALFVIPVSVGAVAGAQPRTEAAGTTTTLRGDSGLLIRRAGTGFRGGRRFSSGRRCIGWSG
ncbi:hypothetical protein [Nocardia sp. alder85J]|uniref:hypothetical protein n=1 Tax=Nocardia sp. alder85J TaxID=2862949 RepID=UPI001CD6E521|nr:hypothetical protein [Nocardia sp. alder85J]MCX4098080.1 hypothetical protein [Nocardia sp. alder85J]